MLIQGKKGQIFRGELEDDGPVVFVSESRCQSCCVCDDVMWLCVCINYNKFKTGPAHYHISVVIEIC